jgi:hypothetical protein
MKLRLRNVAVSLIGSMLPRVLVVAFLTSISNAASLQPSETTEDPLDLEVITLDPQGNPAKTVYYTYDQLLTLPAVTVKTDRDPNTNTPATYTGIHLSDFFEAFDADASLDVIGANCLHKYKQYYDRDYIARHRPILLLKFDGNRPDEWPRAIQSPGAGGQFALPSWADVAASAVNSKDNFRKICNRSTFNESAGRDARLSDIRRRHVQCSRNLYQSDDGYGVIISSMRLATRLGGRRGWNTLQSENGAETGPAWP